MFCPLFIYYMSIRSLSLLDRGVLKNENIIVQPTHGVAVLGKFGGNPKIRTKVAPNSSLYKVYENPLESKGI